MRMHANSLVGNAIDKGNLQASERPEAWCVCHSSTREAESLKKRVRTDASQLDLRHVRYIEKSRTVAAGEMFGFNARWVLNRHIPSRKWRHAGAIGDVKVI